MPLRIYRYGSTKLTNRLAMIPRLLDRALSVAALVLATLFLAGCDTSLPDMWSDPFALSICGLIAFILAIIAIIEVAGSRRSVAGKVIWILILLFLPYLGVIMYYLFADR